MNNAIFVPPPPIFPEILTRRVRFSLKVFIRRVKRVTAYPQMFLSAIRTALGFQIILHKELPLTARTSPKVFRRFRPKMLCPKRKQNRVLIPFAESGKDSQKYMYGHRRHIQARHTFSVEGTFDECFPQFSSLSSAYNSQWRTGPVLSHPRKQGRLSGQPSEKCVQVMQRQKLHLVTL